MPQRCRTGEDELGGDQLIAAVDLARDPPLDLHPIIFCQIPAKLYMPK